jgi:hypothetical protein
MTTAPVADFVPPPLQGAKALLLVATWMGEDLAEGERVIAPFRERVAPTLDLVGPMPYTALQGGVDALSPHGRRVYSKIGYLGELTDEVLDILVTAAEASTEFSLVELTQMGGAVKRVPVDDTPASAFRGAEFFYIMGANWIDEDRDEAELAWVRASDARLEPHRLPGRYINFVAEDDEDGARDAIGEKTYARLARVKAAYDPDGVFSRNPNKRSPVALTA